MTDPTAEEKLALARKDRSTAGFYDENYWTKYWSERFGVSFSIEDPSIKTENEKKRAWLGTLFHDDFKSVLDVGCSFGFFVEHMRREGFQSWGIDLSAFSLSKVPPESSMFVFQSSVTKLPFIDDEMDLVCGFDIIEHLFIEEIFKARDEMCRVAKKYILIKVPTHGYNGPQDIVDRSYESLDKSHVSIYPWSFWARIFEGTGKFRFFNCSLWQEPEFSGTSAEAWISWRRV